MTCCVRQCRITWIFQTFRILKEKQEVNCVLKGLKVLHFLWFWHFIPALFFLYCKALEVNWHFLIILPLMNHLISCVTLLCSSNALAITVLRSSRWWGNESDLHVRRRDRFHSTCHLLTALSWKHRARSEVSKAPAQQEVMPVAAHFKCVEGWMRQIANSPPWQWARDTPASISHYHRAALEQGTLSSDSKKKSESMLSLWCNTVVMEFDWLHMYCRT